MPTQQFFSREKRKKAIKLSLEVELRYLHSQLTSNPFPMWAYIFITRECNLACEYCYVTGKKLREMGIEGADKDMGIDELKQAVDKLHELGTRWISFFGGEPTIRRDELVEIVRYASQEKGMFTQLPTNGTMLLENDYLNDLSRAGIDLIDVSLDSLARFDVSGKDRYHRPNLFYALMEARDRRGFGIKTNYVITKQNMEQLEAILEFGHDNQIIVSIRQAMRPPIIPETWVEPEGIYFTEKDVNQIDGLVDKIIERKQQGYVISEPFAYFEAMKRIIRGEEDIWRCNAGRYHLTINNDGRVMQCEVLTSNFGMHFSKLDKEFFRMIQEQVDANLVQCNDNCLAAAYFCGQYYPKHPIQFLRQQFFRN